MNHSLSITPGQVANYQFTSKGWGSLLSGYTLWAALVTLGNQNLAVVQEGSGILRTTDSSGQAGFLVTFTGQQTAQVNTGTRLVVTLQKAGETPIQVEASLKMIKTLIPSSHP